MKGDNFMSPEKIKAREKELNEKCIKCRRQSPTPPSFERCNYDCTIGTQLHMLDAEKGNGWGSHKHWQK